jgi:hypothetical protein
LAFKQFFTTNTLIESVKRRALIPKNQKTFTDDDFIAFANEELSMGLLPSVLRLHEDFFLFSEDVALVSNKTRYRIPKRALGNKLRDIAFKDNNGNIFEMTRISIEDESDFQGAYTISTAYAFYVEGNDIVLTPSLGNSATGFLRFSYYLRPNELVAESRIGVITAINATTGDVTLSSVPSVFSTSESMDFIKASSPHNTVGIDITPTAINTTTKILTFNVADLPDDLEIGDNIALSCETKIPQIPSDLHVVLAHRVALRCLEALGDSQGLQNANAKLAEFEDRIGNVIDDRVEGSPRKVLNRNGLLRSSLLSRRYGRRGN